ncbi:DUF167 domain-containing protein [Collimonas pratensis]|uniref:UPF0235 protein CPter291_4650 n=1 Tax=Collimonas pratensis TaxID=279113 RepID=A0ABM5ZC82_9BURK|nr:DUF167 domain-containing protein [Collimonas pratensis]AMP16870.1 hypothetical protein CPter291_4650 [Collimonas pratensis]
MSGSAGAGTSAGLDAAWCSPIAGGVRLALQVTPNAKKSQVIGPLDDVLKLRLQAQPIEGKANEALIRFLAELLALPRSKISITHGQTSKKKLVELIGAQLTVDAVVYKLLSSIA